MRKLAYLMVLAFIGSISLAHAQMESENPTNATVNVQGNAQANVPVDTNSTNISVGGSTIYENTNISAPPRSTNAGATGSSTATGGVRTVTGGGGTVSGPSR